MNKKTFNKKRSYEEWYYNYCNKKYIKLFDYFDKDDLIVLNKLDIIVKNELYTEREFEVLDMNLYEFYDLDENNMLIQSELLKMRYVSKEEYEKVLKIFTKVNNDYNL